MSKELENLIKKYQSLELEKIIDYEKFSMISIVWHSTKIEGCSLTETETKVLLEQNITAGGKPLTDHLMVKDHFDAFLFIKQAALQQRKFSVKFIQSVNAYVMRHTGSVHNTVLGNFDSSKGDLRLLQVYVDKKYFPSYQKVPHLLEAFCKAVNARLGKVKDNDIPQLAADVHYNFVNIHPFVDGNGRTARLLMNYILLYYQQPLLKIFTEDRVAYIDALNATEEKEDLSVFRGFIAQQYSKFLQLEIDKHQNLNKGFMMMF